ncbi:MAG: CotH kinase family protein [Bacteroidales bacterium]|nr:CotH kinase family protein [Bacteroidales bacterium]
MRIKVWLLFTIVFGFVFQSSLYSNNLEVIFSSKRGYYNESFLLSLESTEKSAVIRITTDCSVPSMANGVTYKSALEITATTVVKAIAYSSTDTSVLESHTFLFPEDIKKQGKRPAGYPNTWGGSSNISADYEMDPSVINNPAYSGKITDAMKSLPALCLSMSIDDWFDPKTGNYVGYPNSDETREKQVSAEFIYADSEENFDVNCGVQNQGGTSIVNWKVPKQSMRLLFKEEYGPKKLKKKIFPDSDIESINTLVVDALLYSWVHNFDRTQRITSLYFRDQLCSDMQNAMGGLSFHGIYVNLYINGLYWGIYDLHERPDEEFMAEYYDAEDTDFDVIKHNPSTIVAGSNDSYLELLKKARAGFPTYESLEEIKKYLDLPAFINYMILNFYLGNFDWAHQNYYAVINKTEDTGYRFYTWDAEHVMRYSDVNYDATRKNDSGGPTEIHSYLKMNEEYRLMFADAFYKHAFNNGALSIENFEKKFLYRKNEIDLAIILESARWGDYRESMDKVTYTRDDYWIPEVNKVLNEYIPYRRDIVTDQLQRSDNLLYPETLPPVFSRKGGIVNYADAIEIENPNSGEGFIVYTTDGTDPRYPGGDIAGFLYSSAITITEATLIKCRIFNTDKMEWSPLAEMYYSTDKIQNSLMITEIMYNSGEDDIEFIELMNSGNTTIDLFGMTFIDGIEYTFRDNTMLNPGEFIVLTNEMEPFENLYNIRAFDVYNKRLSNKGETIILADYNSNIIDSVSYSDSAPWPEQADGEGYSLELRNTGLDNALASSWRASDTYLGNPEYFNNRTIVQYTALVEAYVYPNPATNWINIVVQGQNFRNEEVFVEVYNTLGELVKKADYDSNSTMMMNISELDPGLYLLRIIGINDNTKTEFSRFLKLN